MSKAEAGPHQEMAVLGEGRGVRIRSSLSPSRPRKLRILCSKIPDLNEDPPEGEGEGSGNTQNLSGPLPQDADYYHTRSVTHLPHELELEILARVPRFEYWKLRFLSKRLSGLVKSGEIFRARQEHGLSEPSVFVLSTGESRWTAFDKDFANSRKLPELPSDICFSSGDKESFCAGTHLFVTGKEEKSVAVWRYELETNIWSKGPEMITPRILFASATRGRVAFVAGGVKIGENGLMEVLNSAEKYDSVTKTWSPIQGMHKRRRFCSGCYLRGKFYVLGGRDENNRNLTCGESYDEATDTWGIIPGMLKDTAFLSFQSPPLVAVASDDLYSLETSSNELRVYDADANAWRKLGAVPVRAEFNNGWGIAFKSLGDRILVMGASSAPSWTKAMSVYTCHPSPNAEELRWEEAKRCGGFQLSHFILCCSVMVA